MNEERRRRRLAEIATEVCGEYTAAPTEIMDVGTISVTERELAFQRIFAVIGDLPAVDRLQLLCSAVSMLVSLPARTVEDAHDIADAFLLDVKDRITQRWGFIERAKAAANAAAEMRVMVDEAFEPGATTSVHGMTKQ